MSFIKHNQMSFKNSHFSFILRVFFKKDIKDTYIFKGHIKDIESYF